MFLRNSYYESKDPPRHRGTDDGSSVLTIVYDYYHLCPYRSNAATQMMWYLQNEVTKLFAWTSFHSYRMTFELCVNYTGFCHHLIYCVCRLGSATCIDEAYSFLIVLLSTCSHHQSFQWINKKYILNISN